MRPVARIEIVLMDDGTIQVSAPIDQDLLCYGLLEKAKDCVREQARKRAEGPRVEIAGPGQAPPNPFTGN